MLIPNAPCRLGVLALASLTIASAASAQQPFPDFGKRFRHYSGNPLLTLESTNPWNLPHPGEMDATAIPGAIHPDVLYFPNGVNGYKYWMIFTPYDGFLGGGPWCLTRPYGPPEECPIPGWESLLRYWERLTLLRSNDGRNWEKTGIDVNPVVTPPPGCAGQEWDKGIHYDPDLVYAQGKGPSPIPNKENWFLYFAFQNECPGGQHGIGLALSVDGVHYTKYALVMPGGFATPTVVYDDSTGTFHMWYLYVAPVVPPDTVGRQTFGYATSSDGIHWSAWNPPSGCTGEDCFKNHVLEPGVGASPACDRGGVSHPDVIMRDDEFWMYYQAQPWDGVSLPRQYHDLMIRRAVAPVATPDQWIKDAGAVLSTDAILTQWAAAGCTTTNPTPGSWTFWKRYGPAPSPTAVTLLYRPSAVVVDNAMYLYYGGLNKVDYNDTHFSDRDIGIAFSTRFSDVLPDHWAYKEVEKVAQAGISSGCGNSNFCPDSAITRKEAAAFIAGGAGLPQNDNDPGHYFCDIPQDTFTAPINAAYAAGVADTCGDCAPPSTKKLFCPDATMNRLQLGLWFYRALGLSPSSNNYFSDVPQPEKPMIESLYVAIHTACDVGLYCPNTLATRAMLAAMTADAFLP